MVFKSPLGYLHGDEGPVVIVPAHVAAYLKRRIPLDQLRIDARSLNDEEIYYVLSSLHRAALAYDPTPTVRSQAAAPTERDSLLNTAEAASLLHLTTRGVRDACGKGRLEAHQEQGRWRISRAAIQRYRDTP